VLETSHPPTWYIPPEDVDWTALAPSGAGRTICEWKGVADYLDVRPTEGQVLAAAAWRYADPLPGFEQIAGYIGFHARHLDCRVDDARVLPQPGGYYGGWVTPDVVGPFKGGAGTRGW
jgi:uncharacterized protein (DUF427 family)